MNGKLAPSQSTVYVSNLPFSLTNNDIHAIFEKYGEVAKVTVVKDKDSRLSKGVAFVLFKDRESALKATEAMNATAVMDRTIKCSIAVDNGRASEFIRKKTYSDKSRCYECGEEGHLSYKCPKNLLGEREQPVKKEKEKKKRRMDGPPRPRPPLKRAGSEEYDGDAPDDEAALMDAAAPAWGSDRTEALQSLLSQQQYHARAPSTTAGGARGPKRKGYFSDEEGSD